MIKKLFLGLALIAALVSCNKEQVNAPVPELGQGKAFVIGATLNPLTKMDYTPLEDGSYKATFLTAGTDALWVYFVNDDGTKKTVIGNPLKLSIDLTTLSADKRSANFTVRSATIPVGATHIYTYFANGGTNTAYVDSVKVDLSSQTSLANACQHHLISAVNPISDIISGTDADTLKAVSLKYQTALVKFQLDLPDGVKFKASASTPMEISGDGIHNTVSLFGKTGGVSSVDKITVVPESSADSTKLTAYAVLLASDDLAGSKITVWNGIYSYIADFAPTVALEGGKAYTASRTLTKGSFSADKWVADEASSLDWSATGVSSTAEWLTFADNKLSWTENTTGKVRTATATDDTGSKYTITQVGPADFAGSWKFNSKVFGRNGTLGRGTDGSFDVNLTIAVNNEGTTANEGTESLTNNLTITGFINSYVAEAFVGIDYEAKTYRFGIFFNGKKAQAASTGKAEYPYVVLLPELGSGYSSYNFSPVPFNGSTNYGWLWFVTEDLETMHYGESDWYKMDSKDILGLSFVACKAENPISSDYALPNSSAAGSYDVIFQCNPTTNASGFLLKKN